MRSSIVVSYIACLASLAAAETVQPGAVISTHDTSPSDSILRYSLPSLHARQDPATCPQGEKRCPRGCYPLSNICCPAGHGCNPDETCIDGGCLRPLGKPTKNTTCTNTANNYLDSFCGDKCMPLAASCCRGDSFCQNGYCATNETCTPWSSNSREGAVFSEDALCGSFSMAPGHQCCLAIDDEFNRKYDGPAASCPRYTTMLPPGAISYRCGDSTTHSPGRAPPTCTGPGSTASTCAELGLDDCGSGCMARGGTCCTGTTGGAGNSTSWTYCPRNGVCAPDGRTCESVLDSDGCGVLQEKCGSGCMRVGSVCCGASSCPAGTTCGPNNQCLKDGAIPSGQWVPEVGNVGILFRSRVVVGRPGATPAGNSTGAGGSGNGPVGNTGKSGSKDNGSAAVAATVSGFQIAAAIAGLIVSFQR
ncbi:uncharacterized protein EV422DRAFT_541244 [Fimicolochytrium jonesii]|uniref:uncharacterized protein n=1 Tax=Fimicolochytrium jonesii TaxID=1396493 RepID=UPI0022FEA71F|nr:uncharacterized protein EV422DRAFT_541244 [Fimicolochytrium jonesii]KAI8817580.1 hypothetical protein EV422DRAFT_541244 [Fimicolochytrium jonesii]